MDLLISLRRLYRGGGGLLLGLAMVSGTGAPAQQPVTGSALAAGNSAQASGGQPTYTLKVNSQLVQLDVVVRNAKSELGLTRKDFSVFENDVPQEIVAFDATTPSAKTGADLAGINSTAELDRRAPEAPVTILVLDEISSRFEDSYFARYSLEKYLGRQGEVLN